MFTQMPQGITSGLAPIPRYKMGGMVQYYNGGGKTYPNEGLKALAKVRPDVVKKMGYQEGGKTYPNEGLKALAKVAPEVVERMGYEEGGEVFPVDQAMNFVQGTGPMGVPMPSGMPAQVFEEGDDEINAALNNMLATVKPQGDAPMMNMEEAPTKDQETKEDPRAQAAEIVEETTQKFQKAARDFVSEIKDKTEGDLTAQQEQEVLSGLQEIDSQYKRAMVKIATTLGDDLTEEEVTLLTPEFLEQLDMVSTGEIATMQPGGLLEDLDLDVSVEGIIGRLTDKAKENFLNRLLKTEKGSDKVETAAEPTPQPAPTARSTVRDTLGEYRGMPLSTELMRERMLRNRLGTLASGKTLQGGVAGLMDVAGQAALAESDAMGKIPEEEADLSAELIKDAFDTETGLLGGGDDSRTATMKNLAKAQEIMNNPNISESDKARLLRILGAGDIATNKETRNELYMLALDIVSKQEAIGGGSLYKDSESLQAAAKKLYEELVKGSPLLEIPEA
jgi:hypothetical protein